MKVRFAMGMGRDVVLCGITLGGVCRDMWRENFGRTTQVMCEITERGNIDET